MPVPVANNDVNQATHQAGVMEVKTHGVGSTLATDCPSEASDVNHLKSHAPHQQLRIGAGAKDKDTFAIAMQQTDFQPTRCQTHLHSNCRRLGATAGWCPFFSLVHHMTAL